METSLVAGIVVLILSVSLGRHFAGTIVSSRVFFRLNSLSSMSIGSRLEVARLLFDFSIMACSGCDSGRVSKRTMDL
jgi:hypothetical protein